MGNKAKEKLIEMRKERCLSQKDMAERLNMDISGYCKRENGQTKMSLNQWAKSAQILDVPLEDIYEPDDTQSVTFNDSTLGNFCAINNNSVSMNVSEAFIEILLKYIIRLDEKITELEKLKTK